MMTPDYRELGGPLKRLFSKLMEKQPADTSQGLIAYLIQSHTAIA
jgi:hypothetical protein